MYGRRVFEALAILVGATFCFTSFVGTAMAQADPQTMREWVLDLNPTHEDAELSGPKGPDDGNYVLTLDVSHVEGRYPTNLVSSESFEDFEVPVGYNGPDGTGDPFFEVTLVYTDAPGLQVTVRMEDFGGWTSDWQESVGVPGGRSAIQIPIVNRGFASSLRRVEFDFDYAWGADATLAVAIDELWVKSDWGAFMIDDFGDIPTGIAGETPKAAEGAVTLAQNAPNPFNPLTTIPFQLAEAGAAQLAVYDVVGRQVRMLVNGPLSAGSHSAQWDGVDAYGAPVPSGVYLARLVAGGTTQTRKMLLVK